MELAVADHAADVQLVTLTGRLDAAGVERVETRFTAAVVAPSRHALIDLSAVSFIGSLGLRMLISVARTMHRRGHKMVLFGVDPLVRGVLDSVALNDLIPIANDRAAAAAMLAG
jgi:anti-anti-sigma factor